MSLDWTASFIYSLLQISCTVLFIHIIKFFALSSDYSFISESISSMFEKLRKGKLLTSIYMKMEHESIAASIFKSVHMEPPDLSGVTLHFSPSQITPHFTPVDGSVSDSCCGILPNVQIAHQGMITDKPIAPLVVHETTRHFPDGPGGVILRIESPEKDAQTPVGRDEPIAVPELAQGPSSLIRESEIATDAGSTIPTTDSSVAATENDGERFADETYLQFCSVSDRTLLMFHLHEMRK